MAILVHRTLLSASVHPKVTLRASVANECEDDALLDVWHASADGAGACGHSEALLKELSSARNPHRARSTAST